MLRRLAILVAALLALPLQAQVENIGVRVRQYGEIAVVTGISVQSGVTDGQPWSGRFRFTRTWLRRGGVWVMVASHSSRCADGVRCE